MRYTIIKRKWRSKRPIFWLMIAELIGLVPILVLFGIEQPDLFRTKFWQIGADLQLNSSPNMILYAYANHRPLPTIPFVWSQALTNFNVAISVISLFLLLAKMIMFIMKVWYPILGTFVSFALCALYATSIYGQAGPDYADARYPSPSPWYIRMSCSIAAPYGAEKQCMMAKGTLAATAYMLFLYVLNLGLAIWSMLPNKKLDEVDEDEDGGGPKMSGAQTEWEMEPKTPRSAMPFTPRTQAFHTLERKLPLRSNYA